MLFNTERKTETLRVLVLHLLLTLSCRGQIQLIGSSQPIVATLGGDIILPLYLEPAEDAVAMTLHWFRPDLDFIFVYVWSAGQDLKHVQHPSYKGRTSLVTDELKKGNISLKLSKVKPSDGGRYTCYLPELNERFTVDLVVDAASPPVLTLSGMDGDKGGVVLDCESRGWYPEPEVLWLDAEGNLLSAGPTETVRGPDDLYTVSSRVTVERHSNSFTCRVHQKSTTQTRDAHITVPEDFFKVPPSSVPIITGLAVSLTGCFLLVLLLLFVIDKSRRIKETAPKDDLNMEKIGKTKHDKLCRKNNQDYQQIEMANHENTMNLKKENRRSGNELLLQNELENKNEEVSSQRPHEEDSSSANHNSTPDSVFVIEVDQQGKYIRVRNTSYQEQHLGGWRLEMMINERKPICYSFDESLKVKSGHTVTMRGPDCGRSSFSSDTWWKEFNPFSSADKLKFTLINISSCERYDLSSSLVNN